ncbi:MAG: MgtC/SapB family protein [Spirochaetaceae bacterium]|jgi:putative Mg2+ transporter-C (MgtC) family protein|nr:MgtC/SapB family protein [Spirochaetaceae bacterium]
MENTSLTEWDMIIRLCLSFAAGGIIGIERSSRRQVAGLRTHILIAMGATLLMLLSIWLPLQHPGMKNGDPGRIAAQVVSGIGFLGAGAIIRLGNNIKGLTTAASLWLIAAVGLTIGAGMFVAAGIAELLSLITLFALDMLEKRLFPNERNKVMEISYKANNADTRETQDIVKSFGVRIQSVDVEQNIWKHKGTRLRLLVGLPESTDLAKLAKALKATNTVERIEIKEKY